MIGALKSVAVAVARKRAAKEIAEQLKGKDGSQQVTALLYLLNEVSFWSEIKRRDLASLLRTVANVLDKK